MTTVTQAATNARALAELVDTLQNWGLSDPQDRAEWVIRQLARCGWRPLEPVPPLRGPVSTEAGRAAAKRLFEQTRREKEQH